MQHEIIMPALGMSQDTGTLLAWHKAEGEAVAAGDILFEVETDKTTMEVEAPANGFVVGISADAGSEVPVGQVIAFIADSADASVKSDSVAATHVEATERSDSELPNGKPVIMPTLGMAQDSGLLIAWCKAAGDKVEVDDVLFEVETDKSIAEVTAEHAGYLGARLAAAGDEVPTGEVIAIITPDTVETPIDRSYEAKSVAPTAEPQETSETTQAIEPKVSAPAQTLSPVESRVLASPKLKRLAMQEGLDLELLVKAGVPQPYHFSDLVQLRELAKSAAATLGAPSTTPTIEITATVDANAFDDFLTWLSAHTGIDNEAQVLASLVGSCSTSINTIGVASLGETLVFRTHQQISATSVCDEMEELHLRDLRNTYIESAQMSSVSLPQITLMRQSERLKIALNAPGTAMHAAEALTLVNNFAERLADPMRQLL